MIPVPFQDEIVQVSRALNEINLQHVFVGGAVAPLLITDQGASHIRPTNDIDAVVGVASRHSSRCRRKAAFSGVSARHGGADVPVGA